jgi:archaeal flagellar protein FlaI
MTFEYQYDEESQKMRINTTGAIFDSSLEDYDVAMAATIDKLLELKRVARIVLAGTREYEYDFTESKMLLEIALAIEKIVNLRLITLKNLVIAGCESEAPQRFQFLRVVANDIRYDPIEAYKNLLREIRKTKTRSERAVDLEKKCTSHYLESALIPIKNILEETKLIQIAIPVLAEHQNRSLYRKFFHPTIKPNFIYTRYISLPPGNAELVERYSIDDTNALSYCTARIQAH